MFRKTIMKQLENEIKVNGNRNLIRQLHDSIYPSIHLQKYQEYIYSGVSEHAMLAMGLWNLQNSINGYSVAQIFLNFIEKNKLPIDERSKYLLQYWAFEVEMIKRTIAIALNSLKQLSSLLFPIKSTTY